MSSSGKRVFLIGTGPLPMHNPKVMGFPSLRVRQCKAPSGAAQHAGGVRSRNKVPDCPRTTRPSGSRAELREVAP